MSGSTLWQRMFGGANSAAAQGTLERPQGQRWGRRCPHCKGPSKIRSSTQVTPAYSEELRLCKNPLCGHIWIDGVEAIRTLSMSSTPDPEIHIPLSRHIRREQIVSTLNQLEQQELFGDAP